MMESLMKRGERIVGAAQRSRLEAIAAAMRGQGLVAEVDEDRVIARGSGLVLRWLANPLLRFAGRVR